IDWPELASFQRAEVRTVKAFVTTRTDSYRAPYGRGILHTSRQCALVGSTNDEHYLPDHTGNRRYLCVPAKRIDFASLMIDRDHIWAEAVATYLAESACPACRASEDTVAGQRPRCAAHRWWFDKGEEREAAEVAEAREEEAPFASIILAWWLGMPPEM